MLIASKLLSASSKIEAWVDSKAVVVVCESDVVSREVGPFVTAVGTNFLRSDSRLHVNQYPLLQTST